MPSAVIASYQPYWALRAHLLARLGRADEAAGAYSRAIGLSEDEAVLAFLAGKKGALPGHQ
jgi:RNA polymerase sigma-70 factor (ECF subfamily)